MTVTVLMLHCITPTRPLSVGGGSSSTQRHVPSKPKMTHAEQKAQQRRQIEEKRRRMQARVMAEMQSDVGDKFMPEVHGAAAVKKPKSEPAAIGAQAAKKLKTDHRSPAATVGQAAKGSPAGTPAAKLCLCFDQTASTLCFQCTGCRNLCPA